MVAITIGTSLRQKQPALLDLPQQRCGCLPAENVIAGGWLKLSEDR
jgi:hypothetical protein